MEIHETETEPNILYEVLTLAEWHQNSDTGPHRSYLNSSISNPSSYFNPLWILEKAKRDDKKSLQTRLPWQLAVSYDGKVIAIVQDTLLEIRTAKDEFSAVVGRAPLPTDEYPQLRKAIWSTDNSYLALARDNGYVSIYNLFGCTVASVLPFSGIRNMYTSNPNMQAIDPILYGSYFQIHPRPVAGLLFLQPKLKTTKWSNELFIFYNDGHMRSILLSPMDYCDSEENANCSLEHYFPQGITSVAYHSDHQAVVIAGNSPSKRDGITLWRIVNDIPCLKIAPEFEKDTPVGRSFLRFFQGYLASPNKSAVIKMQISPKGHILACLHNSGDISLWKYPEVELIRRWAIAQQPNSGEINTRNIYSITDKESFLPVDICWWSDTALVVARKSGAVTVCSLTTLKNLLGESPEFLSSAPLLSSMNGPRSTVLALECESEISKNKMGDELEDTNNENETSALQASIRAALYSVTDMERFEPKRKPPRFIQRTYRLLALKYATPQELYMRKVELDDYESALSLARTYNLDCDLVHQKQWKSSPVSKDSIYDYLDKIKNSYWVVNECIRRVPDTIQSAKELLEFGLKKTEVARGSINSFNYEHRKLLPLRRQILSLLDNLSLYQKIISNPSKYNAEEYDKFRRKSALINAVDLARRENWLGVSIMLTYKGNLILKYWLPILSNFPETLSPLQYRSVLPEFSKNEMVTWTTHELRKPDWSEELEGDDGLTDEEISREYIYHCDRTLKQYEGENLAPALVSRWYVRRIYEIEKNTGMVDNAYLLACLGKEKNIKSLDTVLFHLRSLYSLIYTVQNLDITLPRLETMSPVEQAKLFLSKTTKETFVRDLNNIFYPFAKRCEKRGMGSFYSLVHGLLLALGDKNLDFALRFFAAAKEENALCFKLSMAELMRLAIRCIYNCKEPNQLENDYAILECLPARTASEAIVGPDLHNTIDKMENHLQVCEILQQYKIFKPVIWVVENKENRVVARQIMQQMANYTRDVTSDFTSLQYDLQQIQSYMFTSYDVRRCFELIAATQLNASNERTIGLAKCLLQSTRTDPNKIISYGTAVDLVVTAAKRHFERAQSFDDPAIKLARLCLSFIREPDKLVKEQSDLIEALQVLKDFGVNMLPMQVRNCRKRITLVERCLEMKPIAYRSKQRLLYLANCLRVHDNDQDKRECAVIKLLAKYALKMNDYNFCHQMCNKLIAKNYDGAWSVVRDLAQKNENLSTEVRQDLLAFALIHCPRDQLRILSDIRRNNRPEETDDTSN